MENQIKQELLDMEAFMEADEQLNLMAGIGYDYEAACNESYKMIADRVGCTTEEVAAVHDEMNNQRMAEVHATL